MSTPSNERVNAHQQETEGRESLLGGGDSSRRLLSADIYIIPDEARRLPAPDTVAVDS